MDIFHVEEKFECYCPDDDTCEIALKKEQINGLDNKPITIDEKWKDYGRIICHGPS